MTQKMIPLALLLVAVLLAALAPAAKGQAFQPSSITAIDVRTDVVSAKVNASGAAFQFRVTDAALLKSLKVGQEIYANFTTKQVSLDGKRMLGEIISPPQAPAPLAGPITTPRTAPPTAATPAAKPAPGTPAAAALPALQHTLTPTVTTPSAQPGPNATPPPPPPTFAANGFGHIPAMATNLGIFTCGTSTTINGTSLPAGTSDWAVFTWSSACTRPIQFFQLMLGSDSRTIGLRFDVTSDGFTPLHNVLGGNPSVGVASEIELGTPGRYYLRIYAGGSTITGSWSMTLTAN